VENRIEFNPFANRIAARLEQAQMLPVIEKELLHYEILAAMSRKGFLQSLVFRGGTALRLCYGSARFSEDLDFAGGTGFDPSTLQDLAKSVREGITRRYDVKVFVSEPKQLSFPRGEQDMNNVDVCRWRIQVDTVPSRPDIPYQRIKLEIADVPAYTRSICELKLNYDELPQGYGYILVPVETLPEILADKLVAFPTSKGIRYRDLWDMRWISVQPNQDFSGVRDLVMSKLQDYGIDWFLGQVENRLGELPQIIEGEDFLATMRRFIPKDDIAQTLDQPLFREHLIERVGELYRTHCL